MRQSHVAMDPPTIGINPDILSIRLSQESECWENMTEKVIDYLKKEKINKIMKKDLDLRAKEEEQELEERNHKISNTIAVPVLQKDITQMRRASKGKSIMMDTKDMQKIDDLFYN